MRRRISVLAVALIIACIPMQGVSSASNKHAPGQFIAKQYTEVLGRLPDATGWRWATGVFTSQGCTPAILANINGTFVNSTEFLERRYDNESKVVVLYRSILNRDPDQQGLKVWSNHLNQGLKWSTLQNLFYDSNEFKSLASQICKPLKDTKGTSYYFCTQVAPQLTIGSSQVAINETTLQNMLDSAAKTGDSVTLPQKLLVRLTKPLVIPRNVKLTTVGSPLAQEYIKQARLVRAAAFNDALVKLDSGASLTHVWVDGQRNTPVKYESSRVNVQMRGGTNTAVEHNRIDNSQGWSNIVAMGSAEALPRCENNKIMANVITAYSAEHSGTQPGYTDGISASCEQVRIQRNQIVDTNDVGIVVFKSSGPTDTTVRQQSIIQGNHVLSAGNSMFAALGFDPLFQTDKRPALTYDFSGATFDANIYWTSPNSHFDIAITNGSRAWFGGRTDIVANSGKGGSIINNTTAGLIARVQSGIATSGMLHTTILNNTAQYQYLAAHYGACVKGAMVADKKSGHASGNFGPSIVLDRNFDKCIQAH